VQRTDVITTPRWPAWLNAGALLVAGFIAIAALSLQARPGADVVAVAFPPWWSNARAILAAASANAEIVRLTAVPSLVVVRPRGNDGLAQLRKAGGWLVMDPRALAACLSE
jgi:hypothetical protein